MLTLTRPERIESKDPFFVSSCCCEAVAAAQTQGKVKQVMRLVGTRKPQDGQHQAFMALLGHRTASFGVVHSLGVSYGLTELPWQTVDQT